MRPPDLLPTAVRAFTVRPEDDEEEDEPKHRIPGEEALRPTYFVAIDTETTVDHSQRLLFGAWLYCRLDWRGDRPKMVALDEGLFYEDDLKRWRSDGHDTL